MASNKVYEIVTERILGLLEKGVVPWRKPWKRGGMPSNLLSRKAYRGVNVFLLTCQGFASRYWVTMKQANGLGGHIRKGESSTVVVFWKWVESKEDSDAADSERPEPKNAPVLRYYRVWNIEQTEGLKAPEELGGCDFQPIAEAAKILHHMPNPPRLEHKGQEAWYRPAQDLVNLPRPEMFSCPEAYYATAYHEVSHSTGHPGRLNRPSLLEIAAFGSHTYAKEELVAEMAAAFLCGDAGIDPVTLENSAAYIEGWRKRIGEDPRLVVNAAAAAQKAADYILNRGERRSRRAERTVGARVVGSEGGGRRVFRPFPWAHARSSETNARGSSLCPGPRRGFLPRPESRRRLPRRPPWPALRARQARPGSRRDPAVGPPPSP